MGRQNNEAWLGSKADMYRCLTFKIVLYFDKREVFCFTGLCSLKVVSSLLANPVHRLAKPCPCTLLSWTTLTFIYPLSYSVIQDECFIVTFSLFLNPVNLKRMRWFERDVWDQTIFSKSLDWVAWFWAAFWVCELDHHGCSRDDAWNKSKIKSEWIPTIRFIAINDNRERQNE